MKNWLVAYDKSARPSESRLNKFFVYVEDGEVEVYRNFRDLEDGVRADNVTLGVTVIGGAADEDGDAGLRMKAELARLRAALPRLETELVQWRQRAGRLRREIELLRDLLYGEWWRDDENRVD